MRIASSSLEMSSTHVATQHEEIRESLRMRSGRSRPDFENGAPHPSVAVEISDAGRAAHASDAAESQEDALKNDPQMMLLRSLIEFMTGKKIRLLEASELNPPVEQAAGSVANDGANPAGNTSFGIEYDHHRSYRESEQATFAAKGVVRTADGKTIEFNVELAMQRSHVEETDISIRIGNAPRKQDPLVINFNGNAAQLTGSRFKFDLDADGKMENINFVRPGSGFLVFDRNGDGKANDGSELFGPATGNGFQELALIDDDHNGWIDENDTAYAKLRVWIRDDAGKDRLLSLQEANVGAIALSNVATPFNLKDADNETLGQIRSSSVYLKENGGAGTVQQIDLTV